MKNRLASIAAAVILTTGVGTTAKAAPFTLMIFESREELAKRIDGGDDGKAYWGSYAQFAEAAKTAGILRGGSALNTVDNAASVRLTNGAVAADAAFDADQALRLSGYFQIDVVDAPAAIAWASKLPAANTGRIEIRAGYPAPGMN